MSQLWLSSVERAMLAKLNKHTCDLIESVHLCSSLSVGASSLIVEHTRQCMYTFYCLGNMLILCAEKFFVLLMLRENVMSCFAPNPLPLNIISSSSAVTKLNYVWPPA